MASDLYLLDSSVWMDVLRPNRGSPALRERMRELLAANRVAMTEIVRLELLRGARSDEEFTWLSAQLIGLHELSVRPEGWNMAARIGFQLGRIGATVPTADLIVAAVAITEQATLLHRDRHFETIAAHTMLRSETYEAT